MKQPPLLSFAPVALVVLAFALPAGAQLPPGGGSGRGNGGGIGGGGGFGRIKGPPCPDELDGLPYGMVPCPEPPTCGPDDDPKAPKVVHDGNGCPTVIGSPGAELRTRWTVTKELLDGADGDSDTEFSYEVRVFEGPTSTVLTVHGLISLRNEGELQSFLQGVAVNLQRQDPLAPPAPGPKNNGWTNLLTASAARSAACGGEARTGFGRYSSDPGAVLGFRRRGTGESVELADLEAVGGSGCDSDNDGDGRRTEDPVDGRNNDQDCQDEDGRRTGGYECVEFDALGNCLRRGCPEGTSELVDEDGNDSCFCGLFVEFTAEFDVTAHRDALGLPGCEGGGGYRIELVLSWDGDAGNGSRRATEDVNCNEVLDEDDESTCLRDESELQTLQTVNQHRSFFWPPARDRCEVVELRDDGAWSSDADCLAVDSESLAGELFARIPDASDPCASSSEGLRGTFVVAGTVDCLEADCLAEVVNRAVLAGEACEGLIDDGDGTVVFEVNCDLCPEDPDKTEPGQCGCGVPDTDADGDGVPACDDCDDGDAGRYPGAPEDCDGVDDDCNGVVDDPPDEDGDGWTTCAGDCDDADPAVNPGASEACNGLDDDCNGVVDDAGDGDGDGVADCDDGCPEDPNKTEPGACGCGVADADSDGDGVLDCDDGCPADPAKTEPGECGCGVAEDDADLDGIPDCVDACPEDPDDDLDGDGLCANEDNCPAAANPAQQDADGDGLGDACDDCPNDAGNDVDADGVCGDVDNCPSDANSGQEDADGDGRGDACDECTDADGDGAGRGLPPETCETDCDDADAENFPGNTEVCDGRDNDCDGLVDENEDLDSDGWTTCGGDCDDSDPAVNPGAPEICNGIDDNCDGQVDEDLDTDGDGVADCLDNCPAVANADQADGDGDGVGDACDNCPSDWNAGQDDSDGDGIGNGCDDCPEIDNSLDTDGDGVADCYDNCREEPNADQTDADGDGVGDPCDACPGGDDGDDADSDQTPEACDNCPGLYNADQTDSDGDGLGDDCDDCPFDPDNDADGDGFCGDVDNCPATPNPSQADADTDGDGDACDADDDNDGVDDADDPDDANPHVCGDSDLDGCDDCTVGTDEFGPLPDNQPGNDGPDADSDGLCDAGDACPNDPDNDADGDGLCAGEDNCPASPNPDQLDSDSDGAGDACDPCPADPDDDADGDGVCGDVDNCPASPNPSQADADSDGLGNACDQDDDNDGVLDDEDAAPLDPFVCRDADGDGCDDCSQTGADGSGGSMANDGLDTDGDGTCDLGDADDDNDGVADGGDVAPRDPARCRDEDLDGCDDCSVGVDGFGPLGDALPGDDGPDADADGLCDSGDNCPGVANAGQADADADGVGDACDNCVDAPNPDQSDADSDGFGDACDGCPNDPDPQQLDRDEDGVGDACDNCHQAPNPGQDDADLDGVGDECELPADPAVRHAVTDASGAPSVYLYDQKGVFVASWPTSVENVDPVGASVREIGGAGGTQVLVYVADGTTRRVYEYAEDGSLLRRSRELNMVGGNLVGVAVDAAADRIFGLRNSPFSEVRWFSFVEAFDQSRLGSPVPCVCGADLRGVDVSTRGVTRNGVGLGVDGGSVYVGYELPDEGGETPILRIVRPVVNSFAPKEFSVPLQDASGRALSPMLGLSVDVESGPDDVLWILQAPELRLLGYADPLPSLFPAGGPAVRNDDTIYLAIGNDDATGS